MTRTTGEYADAAEGPRREPLRERQYRQERESMATWTAAKFDDALNRLRCPDAIRDEIVERLARLDGLLK